MSWRRTHGSYLVPQDPRYGAHRWHIVLVADSVGKQSVSDLPGEDARVFLFEVFDVGDHFGRGDARFGAADGSRKDAARLVVSGQDLGDAAVGNSQLSADVAGSDAELCQLDYAKTDAIGQRAAVHEHPAQLVHFTILLHLTLCKKIKKILSIIITL